MGQQIDFGKAIENLKDIGYNPIPSTVKIAIPNAKDLLVRGLKYYQPNAVWLPEYNEIVDWLTDNEGRGLLCYGNCGRGKSLICWKIIPVLLNHYQRLIVSCYEASQINPLLDSVKQNHIIYIDDIGTEGLSVKYGEKRMSFCEIADEAEKRGKLLILTTNLSLEEISNKYGERTMDRLVAITKRVPFVGNSLRK